MFRTCILVSLIHLTAPALGIIMPSRTVDRVSGVLHMTRIQTTDGERDLRLGVSSSYQKVMFDVGECEAFMALNLFVVPDMVKNSQDASIQRHITMLGPGFGLSYSYLFRYSAQLIPFGSWQWVQYNILGATTDRHIFSVGIESRLQVDYAFHRDFEIQLLLGSFFIEDQQRLHWHYGMGLTHRL